MNHQSPPKRVHYFPRQYLRVNEFADEQAYHLAMRRRHNIGHHSWGIVTGLEIVQEEGALLVRPGMAIDGYGRELLLSVSRFISAEIFPQLGSNRLDVWMHYDRVDGEMTPAGYGGCGENASEPYRVNERPRLVFERAGVSRINARRPKGVPQALLDSPASLATTDDPLVIWPVYLGRVTYMPEEKDPSKHFLIDASDRTYAGVVAQVLDHPATAARFEVGRITNEDDERHIGRTTYTYTRKGGDRSFAIFVPLQDDPQVPSVTLEPRFEITVGGNNYLRGETTVYGHVRMAGGAVQFTHPAMVDVPRVQPSIYRVKEGGQDELRIDLGHETAKALVMGFTENDGSFKPAMKLERDQPGNDPVLTIYGDLKVDGLLQGNNILARTLSAETLQALISSFQAGVIAGGKTS